MDSGRYGRWSLWSCTLGGGPFPRRTMSLSNFSPNESQWRASPVAQLSVSNARFWPVAFGRGLGRDCRWRMYQRPITAGWAAGRTWDQCRQATGGVVFGSWSGIDPVDPPAPFGFLGLDHQAELLLQRASDGGPHRVWHIIFGNHRCIIPLARGARAPSDSHHILLTYRRAAPRGGRCHVSLSV